MGNEITNTTGFLERSEHISQNFIADEKVSEELTRKLKLQNDKLKLENDRIKEELAEAKENRGQRRKFSLRMFGLLLGYLVVVVVVCILQGIDCICFSLSDTVLLTLVGTTTANIIGLLFVVIKYLFPEKK